MIYVKINSTISTLLLCSLSMEFYVRCTNKWYNMYDTFMYIINGVLCTLSMLVSKSFKKHFMFLAGENNNINTAFKANSGQE